MGYSMDIHHHFSFLKCLPSDDALLLLMSLLILFHTDTIRGWFSKPTQVRLYVLED